MRRNFAKGLNRQSLRRRLQEAVSFGVRHSFTIAVIILNLIDKWRRFLVTLVMRYSLIGLATELFADSHSIERLIRFT